MSSIYNKIARARAVWLVALALVALAAIAAGITSADHPADQDANRGGTGVTEWTGEWSVTTGDDLTYANQTIDLDGNLIINGGGRLVLVNVTLILHGDELTPQEIIINDGELQLLDQDGDPASSGDRTEVMAADPDVRYYFQAYDDATLVIKNSYLRDCGRQFNLLGIQAGLYLSTPDVTIEGIEISHGFGGIFIDGVDVTVDGVYIHDMNWTGIYVDNGASPVLRECRIEYNERDGIMVRDQSDVEVYDSSIRANNRGVVVETAFLTAWDTAISSNVDLDLDLPTFSQVELYSCQVTESFTQRPVRMENSSLTSTDGNFDISAVEMTASLFLLRNYLTVRVTWSDGTPGTPIPDVPVYIEDTEGQVTQGIFTGADGTVRVPLVAVSYDKKTPTLKTIDFNPFYVKVTFRNVDQDDYVNLRYDSVTKTFQYDDSENPKAVAPPLTEVDVGVETLLDGSACTDNVGISEWNWSFDEFGSRIYLDGEQVRYAFKQAKKYTITLTVTDTSGNSGPGSIASFEVTARDRTPPQADAGPDQTVNQDWAVTLDGSNSTDNVGVVSWTWSFTYEGAPKSLTGNIVTWTFNVPGQYLVVLTVEDATGLTATDSMTVTVVDTIAPTTTVEFTPEMPPDRKYDEIVQLIFNVVDAGPGTPSLSYRINGGEWETVTGALALNLGADLQHGDGTYEIEYFAQDGAGNQEALMTIPAFLVDATSPTFTEMDPAIDQYTTDQASYTIKGRTEPGTTLTINSETVLVGDDGRFEHQVSLDVGDNNFFLLSEDAVGHTAEKTLLIKRQRYQAENGDDGGSGALLYGGVAIVIVVVVLLLVWLFVLKPRKAAGAPEEKAPSPEDWDRV